MKRSLLLGCISLFVSRGLCTGRSPVLMRKVNGREILRSEFE